ncbi:LOW QUALITY PROTEIN: butyrophilin subfamily 1 member A1-like [Leucoraja erinacea]|uniref:LOW QUALITY PROTEIN: butyrophilin subfamily 1 member A1-like n=1 Tax=Leucoraja erinaceus TaxID=7782 RepID=UPI002453DC7B|nr:LOW QUALITY PROTEIN: butyrophilin subfamily 1 member A1-like [Leucoraja erinacea]
MDGSHISILFLLCVHPTLSGRIRIFGPKVDPVVSVGKDVVLECQTEPTTALSNLEVRWFKTDFSSPVHLYTNGHDLLTAQDSAFHGRTELFNKEFSIGNASLKLKNINAFDDGVYTCFIDFKQDYEEAKIRLHVGGMGRQPWIQLEGVGQKGIRVGCRSDGWYPEPHVRWMSGDRANLTGQSVTMEKDKTTGLFTVLNQVEVTSDSVDRFSCLMQNNVLKKEEEAHFEISGVFFPKTNIWMVVFSLLFILVIIVIICQIFHHRKKHQKVKELTLFCKLEGYQDQKINEVSVTLDEKTAHPKLELKNLTRMRLTDSEPIRKESGDCFKDLESVLGSNSFSGGRHYWVVEVAMNQDWSLGVVSESAERREKVEMLPENKFWTIQRVGADCYTNDDPRSVLNANPTPEKVGVYLSYESGRVSFYNVATKSHLHSFTGNNFQGKLYPFLQSGDVDKWVKVSARSVLDLHKEPQSRASGKRRFRKLCVGSPY